MRHPCGGFLYCLIRAKVLGIVMGLFSKSPLTGVRGSAPYAAGVRDNAPYNNCRFGAEPRMRLGFGAAPRVVPAGAGRRLAYNMRVQNGDFSAGGIAAGVRSIIIPERLPHKAARWERK